MDAISTQVWDNPELSLQRLINETRTACLDVYRRDPARIREDARKERATAEGGYGRKQILELVQNASDAMLDDPGRIEVRLTDKHLYVANQGKPFEQDGVTALLYTHLSGKSEDEIGRFGLGFKSIAAISSSPEIYSRTVSFGFDKARALDEISQVVPNVSEVPALRLAWILPIRNARLEDPDLNELMGWATTVVKVPIEHELKAVSDDIRQFPAWFVLFARHVQQIDLLDSVAGTRRTIAINSQGAEGYVLNDSSLQEPLVWKVFEQTHRPSQQALLNAGQAARREQIKVSWAVQMTGRFGVGQLSAFFPINESTTLSGMINAPWKLSDDRSSLIEGDFNREILEQVVPAIVASALPHLVNRESPGKILDLLPARGKEARSWADDVLNQPVMTRVSASESLPDLNGVLRRPKMMRVPPEKISAQLMELWSAAVAKPERWLHPNAVSGAERRAKALRLIAEANGTVASAREWLMASVDEVNASRSAAAIYIADQLRNSSLMSNADMRSSKVVLLEDGDLEAIKAGQVYLRSYQGEHGPSFVHADVAANEAALRILKNEGISTFDSGGELHTLLLEMRRNGIYQWDHIWLAMRTLPVDRALEIIENDLGQNPQRCVKIRSQAGAWELPHDLLMPGGAIPVPKPEDRHAVVDMAFHRPDQQLLQRLGASKTLRTRPDLSPEPWVATYKRKIAEHYIESQKTSRPSPDKLVLNERAVLKPLERMAGLSDSSKVTISKAILTLADRSPWTVRHSSNSSYGTKAYRAPEMVRLREHGLVATGYGPVPFARCLLSTAENVDKYGKFVPIVSDELLSADDAKNLEVKTTIADYKGADWKWMIEKLVELDRPEQLTKLYVSAAGLIDVPAAIPVHMTAGWQAKDAGEIGVVDDKSSYELLREMAVPVLLVDDFEQKVLLMENWGLFDGRESIRADITFVRRGEPTVLVDVYPPLRLYVWQHDLELQICEEIVETVYIEDRGSRERSLRQLRDSNTVLVTSSDDPGILQQVALALELDELDGNAIRDLLNQMEDERLDERRANIRYASDDNERLLLTIGETGLRAIIPSQALAAIESDAGRQLSRGELASLCRDLYGFGTLRKGLKAVGGAELNPPTVWGGRSTARRWVTDLGFGVEWAGEQSHVRREATVRVDGPAKLDPLHGYQEHIAGELQAMLAGRGPARGLISLPTGAGKTRVAVQGIIETLVGEQAITGPVIWIAESDELCEQAVDTWAYLWRSIEGTALPLAISRFWRGNSLNEEPGTFHVIVASRQTLTNAVGKAEYSWLPEASLVVVDEAHISVAPSYTTIFDWLGRGRSRKERRPLLGLTATPFRNSNDAETDRLAGRYDRNRLDRNAFGEGVDPYAHLQEMGVLARVSQRELEGTDLTLTPAEAASIEALSFLPSWAEQRVGDDKERNDRIVDSIKSLPYDFPVLLFAVSVANAEVLAALLSFEGISAASISANTPDDERTTIIDRFKRGELRVITNYNVLAQGFDAPAVRAVYITRPTYSQVLYQQMIGRGLRGPLNNGSEEVLIVNVRDNIAQYGDSLAFYDFEPLWKEL